MSKKHNHCYKVYYCTAAFLHSYIALVCLDVIHLMNLSYQPWGVLISLCTKYYSHTLHDFHGALKF